MCRGAMHGWGCAAWQGGVHGRGACVVGGICTGETASEAGSTHPTGMHSYSTMYNFDPISNLNKNAFQ